MSADFSKRDNVNKKFIYITGAVLGVVSTLIAMLIFAGIILLFNVDRAYATPFSTISVALGCFIASRHTARKIGDKGYIIGLVIGGIVFVLITIISLTFGNGLSLNTLFHFIIMMLSSVVGGIMGVNGNKHKKYI